MAGSPSAGRFMTRWRYGGALARAAVVKGSVRRCRPPQPGARSAAGAQAELAPRRTSWRARTREGVSPALLLVPSIIVVFGIVVYPILKTLYTSLFAVNTPFPGHFPWVGLENYKYALQQSDFWAAIERTAYFTFVSTGFELLLGMGIALLLYAPLRGRWLFRTIVVLPLGAAHDRQRRHVALLLQRPVRGRQRRADPVGHHHLLPRVPELAVRRAEHRRRGPTCGRTPRWWPSSCSPG